eukprot:scaffold133236_cov17-Tisochrysis_lutea.AAC.1
MGWLVVDGIPASSEQKSPHLLSMKSFLTCAKLRRAVLSWKYCKVVLRSCSLLLVAIDQKVSVSDAQLVSALVLFLQ